MAAVLTPVDERPAADVPRTAGCCGGDGGITRRSGLARVGVVLLGATTGLWAGGRSAAAAGKVDRRDFFYQDHPKGLQRCQTCRLYLPRDADSGLCGLVEGGVSPNGWCQAYSPAS